MRNNKEIKEGKPLVEPKTAHASQSAAESLETHGKAEGREALRDYFQSMYEITLSFAREPSSLRNFKKRNQLCQIFCLVEASENSCALAEAQSRFSQEPTLHLNVRRRRQIKLRIN